MKKVKKVRRTRRKESQWRREWRSQNRKVTASNRHILRNMKETKISDEVDSNKTR